MFKQHVRRTIIFTILGVLLAAVATQLVRKVFEANLEMILGEPPVPRSSAVGEDS
jgi:hypothetical protein